MNDKKQCLTAQVLSELIDGKLVDPELTSCSSHLETCVECQNRVRALDATDTLVSSLRGGDSQLERFASSIPAPIFHALKQIPTTDSDMRATRIGNSIQAATGQDSQINHRNNTDQDFIGELLQSSENGQLGCYRLRELLGRGGMGAVFLATDLKLGRQVAIKVMLPKIALIQAARERFFREAKAAASIKSDHIVTVYQVDEFNGNPFLAMELLEGESLESALKEGRRFSISESISIARDIAKGLADAHGKGLIHRDIKPANLWLESSKEGGTKVKILDFGLALAEMDDVHLTHMGTIIGTPAYMAPEQARAQGKIDARADLFSLGCVLYQLCTGEIPFQSATTVGTLIALALNNPVPPKDANCMVPIALSDLILQLLEKDPAKRPESARSVVDRLSSIEKMLEATQALPSVEDASKNRSEPLTDSAHSDANGRVRSKGRNKKVTIGMLSTIIALLAAGVFYWPTADGKIVRIESNDPSVMLAFQNDELKVTGAYDQPLTLKPGKVDLKISKRQSDGTDFEFETNKLIVNKGDQIVLKIEVLDSEVRLLQEGKGLVDSKSIPPSVSSISTTKALDDRTAAIWVLQSGGSVVVELLPSDGTADQNAEASITVKSIAELPSKPFRVTGVTFINTSPLKESDFSNLRNLKYLRSFVLEGELTGQFFTDAAFENLRGCTSLQHLGISGVAISDKALEYLKDKEHLRSIGISGDPGITDVGVELLKSFPALEDLHLGGAKLTDKSAQHFLEFKTLRNLGLTSVVGLTDEGLSRIVQLKTLRMLDLAATNAGEATAKSLSENLELSELNLNYTNLSDQSLDALAALKKLKGIFLRDTQVTQQAIDRFHESIPDCRMEFGTDASPGSYATSIGPESVELMSQTQQIKSLVEALQRANSNFDGRIETKFEGEKLVALSFESRNVSDITPLRNLKHLQSLRIDGNSSSQAGISDLLPLQGLPLTSLSVQNNSQLTSLSPLKGMNLLELRADGCPIQDISSLAGMPLKRLGLWAWNSADIAPLSGMPLVELNIGGNGRVIDLTPLVGAPLEFLCVNSTQVSDLSPLKGMPLIVLLCENTLVSDISPIRGAKLVEFAGDTSRITDLSVLADMPVQRFFCNTINKREIDLLKGFQGLEVINARPAADVLRELTGSKSTSQDK